MSEVDIDAGAKSVLEITRSLADARVGVICLTPTNRDAAWLLFEAGAISKALGDTSLVIPYLLDLKPTDIKKPLADFQAVIANKDGTHRMVAAVNKTLDPGALAEATLNRSFEKWWPEMENALRAVQPTDPEPSQTDSVEMLEQILSGVREISRKFDRDREATEISDDLRKRIRLMRQDEALSEEFSSVLFDWIRRMAPKFASGGQPPPASADSQTNIAPTP
jgi:hypothetical protein